MKQKRAAQQNKLDALEVQADADPDDVDIPLAIAELKDSHGQASSSSCCLPED